jgi:hypothetical protein
VRFFKMPLQQYARFEFEPRSFLAWSHLKVTTTSQDFRLKFATKVEAIDFLLALNWTMNQAQQRVVLPVVRHTLLGLVLKSRLEFIALKTTQSRSVAVLLARSILRCLEEIKHSGEAITNKWNRARIVITKFRLFRIARAEVQRGNFSQEKLRDLQQETATPVAKRVKHGDFNALFKSAS